MQCFVEAHLTQISYQLIELEKGEWKTQSCANVVSTIKYRIEERSSGFGQFQHRDFRSGTEPDGQAGNANPAVHVELLATAFVQAPDVRYAHEAAKVEPAVN